MNTYSIHYWHFRDEVWRLAGYSRGENANQAKRNFRRDPANSVYNECRIRARKSNKAEMQG